MTHNSNMQLANTNINVNQRIRYFTKNDRQPLGSGTHQQYPILGNYRDFIPGNNNNIYLKSNIQCI